MSLSRSLRPTSILRVEGERVREERSDMLAAEEPLEIRIGGKGVAVVMRTPGHDRELAAGFLVTEGIVHRREDVLDIIGCGPTGSTDSNAPQNIMDGLLAAGATVDLERLTRHVFTSSSCGICSKASIDAVRQQFPPIARPLSPRRQILASLPDKLSRAQAAFAMTGALHASALFDVEGSLLTVREDVGRHNALDKIVGHAFFAEQLPLSDRILLVSGRVSFELMQKALAAGIPCVAAISAPTSAAVEFARESGQTLVGFLRGDRMNVYAGTLVE